MSEATEERTPLLDLSTEIEPAEKILIDGTEYDLYSFDHLSDKDEAAVTALFSRFTKIYRLMARTTNRRKEEEQARALQSARTSLIAKMTSIPRDTVQSLPVSVQGKLVKAIREEIADEDELEAGSDEELGDLEDLE
jgi:hypothetical protein